MEKRLLLGCVIAAVLAAGPVQAQHDSGGYRAGETSATPGELAYGADDLVAILRPMKTRSLSPGTGPEPGALGSGVIPDLAIHFGFNSADLTPQAQAQLDELAKALQSDALLTFSFQISGHTDAAGSEDYNEWLSRERAQSVVAYLSEQHQIDPARLAAEGYGERELVDQDDPMSQMNRRVEVRTAP